jgi:hypothetical protein
LPPDTFSERRAMICALCQEPITSTDAWVSLNPQNYVHHCCSLREVTGGIGHQLAHEWCCLVKHDPDAGLTYHQSAIMVAALVDLLGIEEVASRGVVT